MIVASILLLTGETPFPGLAALPTGLGAVAIIWAGAQQPTLVGRLLSSPLPVFFGLISYSLYLWHWPLLVAARALTASNHIPLVPATLAIVAAVVLGWLSWRFVERPFRAPARAGGFSGGSIFALSGAGAAVLVGAAGLVILRGGFESRVPADIMTTYEAAVTQAPLFLECRAGSPTGELCRLGASEASAPAEVMRWGDSHAGALVPGFDAWLDQTGLTGVAAIKTACPPLLGATRGAWEIARGCDTYKDSVITYLESHPEIHTVILAAYLPYSFGDPNLDAVRAGLGNVVARLHAMNRRIVIIEGTPDLDYPVPEAFLQSHLIGSPIPTRSREDFDLRYAAVDQNSWMNWPCPIRSPGSAWRMCCARTPAPLNSRAGCSTGIVTT